MLKKYFRNKILMHILIICTLHSVSKNNPSLKKREKSIAWNNSIPRMNENNIVQFRRDTIKTTLVSTKNQSRRPPCFVAKHRNKPSSIKILRTNLDPVTRDQRLNEELLIRASITNSFLLSFFLGRV